MTLTPKSAMSQKKENETQTEFTLRLIREENYRAVRNFVVDARPDVSAIASEHVIGYNSGYLAMKKEIARYIDNLIEQP